MDSNLNSAVKCAAFAGISVTLVILLLATMVNVVGAMMDEGRSALAASLYFIPLSAIIAAFISFMDLS